jgi:hypothetical protein
MLQLIRIVLPKFQTPLADGLMGHLDPTGQQHLFYVAVTQREAIIEPDPMTDDFAGKAVMFVALGVSGWRHGWLPILGFDGACREASAGVSISRVREQGQQLDNALLKSLLMKYLPGRPLLLPSRVINRVSYLQTGFRHPTPTRPPSASWTCTSAVCWRQRKDG